MNQTPFNFLEDLCRSHRQSLKRIEELINVHSDKVKEYPEYREAAVLCRFIFDRENKYELLAHPNEHGRFYESAIDFEILCDTIYHALVDDGDIAFVQIEDYLCPRIVFKSRWELTLEDLITQSQKDCLERLNEFKAKFHKPLLEFKLNFFNGVPEYINAVEQYDKECEERYKKAKVVISNIGSAGPSL
jgi:hypothetical protein